MAASRYDKGDLPWGWWLRQVDGSVEDGDGGKWRNVREAFWEGRLGFKSVHLADEQQELLTRVLNSIDARWLDGGESRHDIFDGDMMFWRFYQCWLGSVGLLDLSGRTSVFEAPLSDEGRAVLRMLRATRDPVWVEMTFDEVIDVVWRANRGGADEAREGALRQFERRAVGLPHVFAREKLGRAFLVTLTAIDTTERMPMCRVTWTCTFADERIRDDLFGWLAERAHRWEDWSKIATSRGARALTQHLLTLLVASPIGSIPSVSR